jgi:hypothetical protein
MGTDQGVGPLLIQYHYHPINRRESVLQCRYLPSLLLCHLHDAFKQQVRVLKQLGDVVPHDAIQHFSPV